MQQKAKETNKCFYCLYLSFHLIVISPSTQYYNAKVTITERKKICENANETISVSVTLHPKYIQAMIRYVLLPSNSTDTFTREPMLLPNI